MTNPTRVTKTYCCYGKIIWDVFTEFIKEFFHCLSSLHTDQIHLYIYNHQLQNVADDTERLSDFQIVTKFQEVFYSVKNLVFGFLSNAN